MSSLVVFELIFFAHVVICNEFLNDEIGFDSSSNPSSYTDNDDNYTIATTTNNESSLSNFTKLTSTTTTSPITTTDYCKKNILS